MKIPENYLPVMPYLILDDSAGFLEFAKTVFNATEQLIVPDAKNPGRTIMHAEIKIHDAVIMFAQATVDWKAKSAGMFLYVSNVDAVYQKAMAANCTSLTSPQKQDYGYTAGFSDRFENQWWIVQGDVE